MIAIGQSNWRLLCTGPIKGVSQNGAKYDTREMLRELRHWRQAMTLDLYPDELPRPDRLRFPRW